MRKWNSKRSNLSRLLGKDVLWLMVFALPAVAKGQAPVPPQGVFCSAEGTGVWAGRTAAFRYQSSLLIPGTPRESDTLTLYVDEQPAAIFPLRRVSDAPLDFAGAAELNANVIIRASTDSSMAFKVELRDWRNPGAVAVGRCEWNYGD